LAGSFSGAGASNCTPCLAGTYSDTTGASSISVCMPCLAGSFSPMGAVDCTHCSPGTYSKTSSASECLTCPPGTSSPEQSVSCIPTGLSYQTIIISVLSSFFGALLLAGMVIFLVIKYRRMRTKLGDSGGECSLAYVNRFIMPGYQLPTTPGFNQMIKKQGRYFWSMDYLLVHIIFVSTEEAMLIGSVQYTWLIQDLQKVDRIKTPWIIVLGHRPMYSAIAYPDGSAEYLRSSIEPLFNAYQVNLALWGHVHLYERMCPIFQGICVGTYENPGGTVHIVTGAGGKEYDWDSETSDNSTLAYMDEYYAYEYGYLRMEFANSTKLKLEFVTSVDGRVLDEAWLSNMWTESDANSLMPDKRVKLFLFASILYLLFSSFEYLEK